jgi:hypothetical protein
LNGGILKPRPPAFSLLGQDTAHLLESRHSRLDKGWEAAGAQKIGWALLKQIGDAIFDAQSYLMIQKPAFSSTLISFWHNAMRRLGYALVIIFERLPTVCMSKDRVAWLGGMGSLRL